MVLIDVFLILVIFLLMNFFSIGEIFFMSKNMEFFKVVLGEVLERILVVKVDEGKMYLEDKEVMMEGLVVELLEFCKSW